MKRILSYLEKLIESNSGVSSKSFFLVAVTLIGCLLLIIVGFVLVWEVLQQGTIKTDLTGLAAFVGSVASLFATAGVTKAWSERRGNDCGNNNNCNNDKLIKGEEKDGHNSKENR